MTDLADLNHELYQLMRLHREMRSWRWCLYPKTMRRAADVAYAAHLHALLEFFRNGRGGADLSRVNCPKRSDLRVSELDSSRTRWRVLLYLFQGSGSKASASTSGGLQWP